VGAQVDRLPEGVGVAPAPEVAPFGAWYRRQRELRGISVFYVAARTKLTPERVREIEESRETLETDGIGRGTARALALAIGADPEEAASRLGERRTVRAARAFGVSWLRGLVWTWGRRVGLAIVVALGLWLLGLWLGGTGGSAPALVYKPDYVEKLLHPN
jgi:hypothetical protein